jgi:hypothetical protein
MAQVRSIPSLTSWWIGGFGLVILGAYVAGLTHLMGTSSYDSWGPLVLVPILLVVSLPMLRNEARRQNDQRLFAILVTALVLKLVGAIVRHYVAYEIYGGVADANDYHRHGLLLSEQFRAGNFDTGLSSLTGTNFMRFFTGLAYVFIGTSRLGGFFFFSWLAFLGMFLFYRAFVIAVPEGGSRRYAVLLLFLPSLLFWPSSIGKEAWMLFALGVAAFGAARIFTAKRIRGLLIAGLGLWLAALVRPHVAGMLALALVAAYLVPRSRRLSGRLSAPAKAAMLAVLLIGGVMLLMRTQSFLGAAEIFTPSGVVSELETISQRSDSGGSQFSPTIVRSLADLPLAAGTVLFRPLITEAHNGQALLSALESTFLILLTLAGIGGIIAAIRSIRRQPYVAMAVLYTGMFIVAFSSFPNFGLLARERAQLMPMYLVLLTIPAARRRVPPPGQRGRVPTPGHRE